VSTGDSEASGRPSDEQLRQLVDSIPAMAWIVSPDGRMEFVNQRWQDYLGISLQQVRDAPLDRIHPADLSEARAKWQRCVQAGEAYEREMRLRRADGVYRWFLVRTVALRDAQGRIVRWYGMGTDIEDRKQADEAVARNRSLLDLVLAALPVGVIVMDASGDVVMANAAANRIWGGDPIVRAAERRKRTSGRWHYSGEPIEPHEWAAARALATGEASLDELIDINTFDGTCKTIRSSAVPIRDGAGAIVGTVVINEDVTERVRADEAVARNRSLLDLVLATLPVGVIVMDAKGSVVMANSASKRVWSDDPIVSGPDRWQRSKGYWRHSGEPIEPQEWASARALAKGDSSLDELIDIDTYAGTRKTIRNSAVPIRDNAGAIVGAVVINEDVTERVRAEDAIAGHRELLDTVLATLPVGVSVLDASGSVLLHNAASKRILGSDPIVPGAERYGALKGYWRHSGLPIAPDEWPSARVLATGRPVIDALLDLESLDGTRKTIRNAAVAIRDKQGTVVGVVVAAEDATDRVRAEDQLREAAEQTQRLSRQLLTLQEEERRHLSRELHDEFGQLLAAIGLQIGVAKSRAGPEAVPALETAAELVQQAGEQVRGLALELRPTMLETSGLDAAVLWLAKEFARRAGIATQVSGHVDDTPHEVSIALFRVVQEALTNVAKHANARNVWIDLRRSENAAEASVRDDGIGIDVELALARAARDGRLGLVGMRERVDILGGRIRFTSSGEGTTIHAAVPLAARSSRQ
jgi:PAS domain S-box-containing protein